YAKWVSASKRPHPLENASTLGFSDISDILARSPPKGARQVKGASEIIIWIDLLPKPFCVTPSAQYRVKKIWLCLLLSGVRFGDVRQISGLTAVNEMREMRISDPWPAFTSSQRLYGKSISSGGASNGLLSPFQLPIAGPGLQRSWSTADKSKAIRKLQAGGVVFESASDERMDDDPVYELPPRRINPYARGSARHTLRVLLPMYGCSTARKRKSAETFE
ncbi:hypothetical protein LTR46_011864, partial [Exophiala xenobiotica]